MQGITSFLASLDYIHWIIQATFPHLFKSRLHNLFEVDRQYGVTFLQRWIYLMIFLALDALN